MRITARALNRAVLARQLLLGHEPVGVVDAVRRVVALQAQQPASPYLALWNRLAGSTPAELDAAVAAHQVVRTTLMRVTLHAIHAEDYRVFREAMDPTLRATRLGDRRFTASGLTAGDADALIPDLLEYADRPRTADEMRAWLEERLGAPMDAGAWRMLRQYAPLLHAPTGGPWSFDGRQSYVAARTRPVLADPDVSAEALQILIRRYLEGFGPATVADMARFATVRQTRVKTAVQALGGELERLEGSGGAVMYDLPGAPRPPEDTPAPPRLMAMWDSILLAHADRSRFIPPAHRTHVIRRNGDVLPTLLVDGHVAGVWRAVEKGIEATAFHPLSDEVWEELAAEARSLLSLLADREPAVYRRYDHWWAKLPDADTRILPER
ncbi:winged helix DNA-binding domain-containing protein [Thermomonospora amylolytica]|uniref:winged helix DNA-binding domain-containing protein n=1 Tax=Thermomonospora amylolytica TaxID=1411117 RepID=UPI000E6D5328|nr:winged helix DNA-binding domain-containing protein [Thermomonospora amylolytica]